MNADLTIPWDDALIEAQKTEFFKHLHSAMLKPCLAASYSMLRDWNMAEECVQEAFVILWNKLDTLDPETDIARWLFATVRHRTLKVLTRQARESPIDPDSAVALLDETEGTGSVANDHDRSEGLARLLKMLPPQEHTALVLKAVKGLSGREIAQVMGCNVGTVRTCLSRARRRLAHITRRAPLPSDDTELPAP
jgi:RNA polymerase sigma-70 factor (ECF subfamily)